MLIGSELVQYPSSTLKTASATFFLEEESCSSLGGKVSAVSFEKKVWILTERVTLVVES